MLEAKRTFEEVLTITRLELFINQTLKTKIHRLEKSIPSLPIYTTAIRKECATGLPILVLQVTKVYI